MFTSKGFIPDVAIRSPRCGPGPFSGSPLSTPCCTLYTPATQTSELAAYVPFLTFVHLLTQVPLTRMTWARASPGIGQPGFPGHPCSLLPTLWNSPMYICFLIPPPGCCVPKVLTVESWKESLFFFFTV